MRHEDDYARSLADDAVRQRRKGMLGLTHISPLSKFAAELRNEGRVEVGRGRRGCGSISFRRARLRLLSSSSPSRYFRNKSQDVCSV
jgi:hypothetical protein